MIRLTAIYSHPTGGTKKTWNLATSPRVRPFFTDSNTTLCPSMMDDREEFDAHEGHQAAPVPKDLS